jgi:hypothetical protein
LRPAERFDVGADVTEDVTAAERARIERILRPPGDPLGLRLGQSDYVVTSPFLEGFVRRSARADLSLGEKVLRLPVVSWFRPLPMPKPPGGGRYFLWGERPESWEHVSRPVPGPRAVDSGI